MIPITRYSIKDQRLSPWIKFIWHLRAEGADFHYKLLPTEAIDLLLNLGSDTVYERECSLITAPPFHINGLRSKASLIHQRGDVDIFGIAFQPYGLFPFVHQPLTGLQDSIVDLQELCPILAEKLRSAVADDRYAVSLIEQALSDHLVVSHPFIENVSLLSEFLWSDGEFTVQSFCREKSINIKTFERYSTAYTGFTPKMLLRIIRFQNMSNQLTHQSAQTMTDITFDNNFADQSHFIKEFRRFSNVAPSKFRSEKATVKENAQYTYL